MNWYLVHTKPRQEQVALSNLTQQGYECYLPMRRCELQSSSGLIVVAEPLFPRYLFIRMGSDSHAKGWSPVRSTKGVSRMVCFGSNPARADDSLVRQLMACDGIVQRGTDLRCGDRVRIGNGPLDGLEAIYQNHEGEQRAMVLIEMLTRSTVLHIDRQHLRKIV